MDKVRITLETEIFKINGVNNCKKIASMYKFNIPSINIAWPLTMCEYCEIYEYHTQ